LNLHWSRIALNCRDQRTTEEFYQKWIGFERAEQYRSARNRPCSLAREMPTLNFSTLPQTHSRRLRSTDLRIGDRQTCGFSNRRPGYVLRPDRRRGSDFPGPAQLRSFYPRMAQRVVDRSDGVIVEVSQGYRDESPTENAVPA
jgi:glyoxylase I family protein